MVCPIRWRYLLRGSAGSQAVGAGHAEGAPQSGKWELGKIALKLKPEIEAKARANQSAAGGDKSDKGALLTTLSEALPSVSTRKVSWAIHPILYLNSTP